MFESDYIEAPIIRHQDVIDLVFQLTGGEGFIAGGFARFCVSNNESPINPGDIDVFCVSQDVFDRIRAAFRAHPDCVRKSETSIETKFEFRMSTGWHRNAYAIQLIRPVQIFNMVSDGDVNRVLDNFDFTVSKCAILPSGKAVAHADFYEHDKANELVITNIHCPISSMKRVIKYCNKGFRIENRELLKLFDDYENRAAEWKELVRAGLNADDLNSWPEERREQFVQTMYFD